MNTPEDMHVTLPVRKDVQPQYPSKTWRLRAWLLRLYAHKVGDQPVGPVNVFWRRQTPDTTDGLEDSNEP